VCTATAPSTSSGRYRNGGAKRLDAGYAATAPEPRRMAGCHGHSARNLLTPLSATVLSTPQLLSATGVQNDSMQVTRPQRPCLVGWQVFHGGVRTTALNLLTPLSATVLSTPQPLSATAVPRDSMRVHAATAPGPRRLAGFPWRCPHHSLKPPDTVVRNGVVRTTSVVRNECAKRLDAGSHSH
jgi:hypothetical protein